MTENPTRIDPRLLEAVNAKNELRGRFKDPFLAGYDPLFGLVVTNSTPAEVVVILKEEMPEDLRERLVEGISVNIRFDVDQNTSAGSVENRTV